MESMFHCAYSFNQDISGWNINDNADLSGIYSYCHIIQKYKAIQKNNNKNE